MRVALISCTSKKKEYKCKASELYSESPRFALAYEYAKKKCDRIYILSAKHGLVSADEIIEPYNETLKDKSASERKRWSLSVFMELQSKFSLEEDEFLILAGSAYNEHLLPYIKKYELPLKGKSLGNWIPELKAMLGCNSFVLFDDHCFLLHQTFNNMQRLYWDEIDQIPFNNGIYIMFEKGEKFLNMDRIVRVGTHKAEDRLKKRLKDHFIAKNANGSIFRKNIGRALLHEDNDSYESIWELDTSKIPVRQANIDKINLEYEDYIESRISDYLKTNISYVCFQVNSELERLRLEEGLLSTLSQAGNFVSSNSWLGLKSPKTEIVNSGLWNVQGLTGTPLTNEEIEKIQDLIGNRQHINDRSSIEDNKMVVNSNNKYNTIKSIEKSDGIVLSKGKVSTSEIKDFIKNILISSKNNGLNYIEIISGDIHRRMNLNNKMPSVCSAMYQLMTEKDVILHKTDSGKSSTIKIRYYL
jgi:hypothetical protein